MVGRCHETLGIHDAGILDHGDPGADGDRDLLAGEDKGMAGHGLPHAFGDDAALGDVGAPANDREFLASNALWNDADWQSKFKEQASGNNSARFALSVTGEEINLVVETVDPVHYHAERYSGKEEYLAEGIGDDGGHRNTIWGGDFINVRNTVTGFSALSNPAVISRRE